MNILVLSVVSFIFTFNVHILKETMHMKETLVFTITITITIKYYYYCYYFMLQSGMLGFVIFFPTVFKTCYLIYLFTGIFICSSWSFSELSFLFWESIFIFLGLLMNADDINCSENPLLLPSRLQTLSFFLPDCRIEKKKCSPF